MLVPVLAASGVDSGGSGRPGSNRRHPAWKAGALPTELHPRPASVAPWIRTRGRGTPEALVLVPLITAAYLLALRRYPRRAWRIACFLAAMVLLLAVSVTPIHTLGDALPADGPPAPERRSRRVGAASRRPRDPACARRSARPPRRSSARSRTRRSRFRSGSRTTWSGTSPGSTTRRSRTRARSSISSTRSTSSQESRCGGASSRTSRTVSARARAPRYVFAAFVLASPIGFVMALVPNAIYDFYVNAHHRVWGLDPLEDQQLGGHADGGRAGGRLLRGVRVLVLSLSLRGGAEGGR